MIEYQGRIVQKDQFAAEKKRKQQVIDYETKIATLEGLLEDEKQENAKLREINGELKARIDRDRNRIANLNVKVQEANA